MLRAVVSDVTVYFFTIFLTHLLLVVTLETARVWSLSLSFGLSPRRGDADDHPPTLARPETPPCNVRAPSAPVCSLTTFIDFISSGLEVYVT